MYRSKKEGNVQELHRRKEMCRSKKKGNMQE